MNSGGDLMFVVSVTVLRCYGVTVLECYCVTVLRCYCVTVLLTVYCCVVTVKRSPLPYKIILYFPV